MPRDGAGNYTLPNPSVIGGTTITTAWANSTLDDVAGALTDSLSRSGLGGMQGQLAFDDGTEALPGIGWLNEISSGFRRFGAGDMRGVILGEDKIRVINDGVNPSGSERPFQIWDGSAWREAFYGEPDVFTPPMVNFFAARILVGGTIVQSFNVPSILGGGSGTVQLNFTDFPPTNQYVVTASIGPGGTSNPSIAVTGLGSTNMNVRTYDNTGSLVAQEFAVAGYYVP